jgi:hypothetical protein
VKSRLKKRFKTDLVVGGAIFIVTLFIFLLSPVQQIADSNYSMLVSESLLHHGSFALDQYTIPGFNSSLPTQPTADFKPYQLHLKQGHIHYYYPVGSSVLSVPYVAAMNLVGVSAVDEKGVFDYTGEKRVEASLAALLMAALAAVFFFTGRLLLPITWSVLIALGGVLGTQVFSTASRGLWSDTWGIFLLGVIVWMLLAHERGKHPLSPILLASLLAWTYFVRPTYWIPVVAVSVYLLISYPSLFKRYALTGGAWCVGFLVYSWYQFGQVLPDYYRANQLTFEAFGVAFAANLVSPSRGLLIFVPALAFIFYLLVRYRKELEHRRLIVLAVSIIIGHLIAVAGVFPWWSGHSYGPRLTTGLVPWFVLLSILGVKAALTAREKYPSKDATLGWKMEWVVGFLLLACSVAINGNGAVNRRTSNWNLRPVNVDERPERVWDWRDPQFLAK